MCSIDFVLYQKKPNFDTGIAFSKRDIHVGVYRSIEKLGYLSSTSKWYLLAYWCRNSIKLVCILIGVILLPSSWWGLRMCGCSISIPQLGAFDVTFEWNWCSLLRLLTLISVDGVQFLAKTAVFLIVSLSKGLLLYFMCFDQHVKYRMPRGFSLTSSLLLDYNVKQYIDTYTHTYISFE